MNPRRGDIFWIDWNPARGSEQAGKRPGLIISTDMANLNPAYPNVIVAALSTKGRQIPTHVEVSPSSSNGLSQVTYVKCEQILTISKARLLEQIGALSKEHIAKVDASIKRALDLA